MKREPTEDQLPDRHLGRPLLVVLSSIGMLALIAGVWGWREFFPDHFFLDHSNVYYDVSALVHAAPNASPTFATTAILAAELKQRLQNDGPDVVLGFSERPVIVAWGDFLQHRRLRKLLQSMKHDAVRER